MDKKNGLIGILLLASAFGLMFWQSKTVNEQIEQERTNQQVEQQQQAAEIANQPFLTQGSATAGTSDPFQVVQEQPIVPEAVVELEPEVFYTLENDYLAVRFTSRGGAIKDVVFKKFPAVQDKPEPYVFNSNSDAPALGFCYMDSSGKLQDYAPNYKLVSQSGDQILFSATSPEGVQIYRGYSLANDLSDRDPYLIRHETRFTNNSNHNIDLKTLFVHLGTYPPTKGDTFGEYLNFGYYDGKDAEFVKIGNFHDSKGFFGIGKRSGVSEVFKTINPVIWGSIKNQFFTSVLTPKIPASGIYVSTVDLGDENYLESLTGSLAIDLGQINSGDSQLVNFEYYVGPKEYTRLAALGQNQDYIMQFGFFRYISQLLLVVMKAVNLVIPNWGLTIIIVTVIIKLLLWPLTAIQVRSAKRMASIQKPLQELKEKYKDNQQKIQAETMKLFKENKVNPAAGCLPLLVQLPIFLGLYFMLRTASELRFASFLWIPDLSVPDTVGLLAGFPINILPVLMAVSMFWQMRSTPTPTTDNLQKKVFQLMPFIFLIFCYSFPSGLVLYWTVQNLLTILQQTLMKNMKEPVVATSTQETTNSATKKGTSRQKLKRQQRKR